MSIELILGIIGTVSGIAGASYAVYQIAYNRPRLEIDDARCYHYFGEGPYRNTTFFQLRCHINNKGHIGTRLTKIKFEANADRHYSTTTPYMYESRIEPSDSTRIRSTFSFDGVQFTQQNVNCKVTLYHTYKRIVFEVISQLVNISDLARL